jgi:hypothetical protein
MLLNAAGFINRDAVLADLKAGPVLLALRPASGKTQLIINMLHPSRLLMIMVPTQALQQQVCARHKCSVRDINVSTQILSDIQYRRAQSIKGCDARRQDPRCVVAANSAIVEIIGALCGCRSNISRNSSCR